MSNANTLMARNQDFAANFQAGDMPILPKLRTIILTCVDARVDPAHVLGLELGEAVVIRNNGGRVTREVLEEIAALAFIVARMDGDAPKPFELVIVQHTQCGAERFALPEVQGAIKANLGIDVSGSAIADHDQSLLDDIARLRDAPEIPDHVIVSGFVYDVKSGQMRQVAAPKALGDA